MIRRLKIYYSISPHIASASTPIIFGKFNYSIDNCIMQNHFDNKDALYDNNVHKSG